MLHVFPFLNFDLIYMMFYNDMSLASESRAQPGKPYPHSYGDSLVELVCRSDGHQSPANGNSILLICDAP